MHAVRSGQPMVYHGGKITSRPKDRTWHGNAPVSRVMGENGAPKPADLRREPWSLVRLPIVTERQRKIHPRVKEYARPHCHKIPWSGAIVACEARSDCREYLRDVLTRKMGEVHLSGRRDPLSGGLHTTVK